MKTIPAIALLGVTLLGSTTAAAAEKKTVPETSTIVFENDKVRTILFETNAGKAVCGLGLHSHPAHLFIMITPGKLRITTPDGKEEIVDGKAGDVGWEPAVTHRVDCISGENVKTYLVEVKDQDWKPSTGLSPAITK
jgi:hypothetical protein